MVFITFTVLSFIFHRMFEKKLYQEKQSKYDLHLFITKVAVYNWQGGTIIGGLSPRRIRRGLSPPIIVPGREPVVKPGTRFEVN